MAFPRHLWMAPGRCAVVIGLLGLAFAHQNSVAEFRELSLRARTHVDTRRLWHERGMHSSDQIGDSWFNQIWDGAPFNGNPFVLNLVQSLLPNCTAVFETGTFRGSTTAFLAAMWPRLPVTTVEYWKVDAESVRKKISEATDELSAAHLRARTPFIVQKTRELEAALDGHTYNLDCHDSRERVLRQFPNVEQLYGDSAQQVAQRAPAVCQSGQPLFYLDAHATGVPSDLQYPVCMSAHGCVYAHVCLYSTCIYACTSLERSSRWKSVRLLRRAQVPGCSLTITFCLSHTPIAS